MGVAAASSINWLLQFVSQAALSWALHLIKTGFCQSLMSYDIGLKSGLSMELDSKSMVFHSASAR